MLGELVRGMLPANWRRYTVPRGCTVIQWITDFSQRVKQLQQVSQVVSSAGAKELQVHILCHILKHISLIIIIYVLEFSGLVGRFT